MRGLGSSQGSGCPRVPIVFIAWSTSRPVAVGAFCGLTADTGVAFIPCFTRMGVDFGLTSHAMNLAAMSGFLDLALTSSELERLKIARGLSPAFFGGGSM